MSEEEDRLCNGYCLERHQDCGLLCRHQYLIQEFDQFLAAALSRHLPESQFLLPISHHQNRNTDIDSSSDSSIQDHDRIRRRRVVRSPANEQWTARECNRLIRLVRRQMARMVNLSVGATGIVTIDYLRRRNWRRIAKKLGTGRSALSCRRAYQNLMRRQEQQESVA
ncbi:hypothetical protein BGX27_004984 [Mortierella sp. AM989]|nr:hypothetical protein BGX27_004984 [Mortierella sp. AM989]